MKFLILTISLGGGHNQPARVLKEKIEEKGHNAIIYDIFRKNKNEKHIYEDLFYKLTFNYPKIYSLFYNIGDTHLMSNIMKGYFILDVIKINKIIEENNIEGIICTAPFATQMVSMLKKIYKKNIYTMQIISDLYPQAIYCDDKIDSYIVGTKYTIEDLVNNKNVDINKIKNYGIPVRKEFIENKKKIEKVNDKLNILIMTGSFGFGDVKKTLEYIIKSDIKNLYITVICGTNKDLKSELEEIYKDKDNIKILGYYENIYEIMLESDILISKPSGQTITEAFYMGLPMIIPYYIEGQEKKNKEILVNNNLAFEVSDIKEIGNCIKDIMSDKNKYNRAKNNILEIIKDYDIDKTIELLINGSKNKKEENL